MEYIKQLLKEKEDEINDLTKDLESLMKENIELREELTATREVLGNYNAQLLNKDLRIQHLENNSAAWLQVHKDYREV